MNKLVLGLKLILAIPLMALIVVTELLLYIQER